MLMSKVETASDKAAFHLSTSVSFQSGKMLPFPGLKRNWTEPRGKRMSQYTVLLKLLGFGDTVTFVL